MTFIETTERQHADRSPLRDRPARDPCGGNAGHGDRVAASRVWEAEQAVVFTRSMALGYAGAQNPLFFREDSAVLFGDAWERVEEVLRDSALSARRWVSDERHCVGRFLVLVGAAPGPERVLPLVGRRAADTPSCPPAA